MLHKKECWQYNLEYGSYTLSVPIEKFETFEETSMQLEETDDFILDLYDLIVDYNKLDKLLNLDKDDCIML
ncbi:hypothetical protein AsGV045 [Agrotis segetum granulovirus]|uniref:Uncharacterized protein n=1 Tax=Agrotis segetum granulosis virus TaxID=10464 RepID=A0A023MIK6_GVAS|nr:hypothetical protein AsGV045 [Agrotis segetum granulovirus]AHN92084.1 hypothetical protein AsGV045 [Agrotis segetum granulovirus]AKN63319.1 hypothetical protein AsGV045 [Agrotis segetum granulovirus]